MPDGPMTYHRLRSTLPGHPSAGLQVRAVVRHSGICFGPMQRSQGHMRSQAGHRTEQAWEECLLIHQLRVIQQCRALVRSCVAVTSKSGHYTGDFQQGIPEMDSDAITFAPMAAWIGILNCCLGMSSFSFVTSARPIL